MYSLSTTQDDDAARAPSRDGDADADADETTRLLGAGTRTLHDAPSPDPESEGPPRTDSWVGFKEYEHLPWYRRPSVRSFGTRSSQYSPADYRADADTPSRSFGSSRHMRYLLWHSAVR